jgi:hypothetical protein
LIYELKKYIPRPAAIDVYKREQDQDVPGLLNAGIDNLLKLDYIYQDSAGQGFQRK